MNPKQVKGAGFALIAAISIMGFLVLLAVGLFSLSAVSLKVASQAMAKVKAQANAQMAIHVALGELQREMGPDMRVSTTSSILDADENTEAMEGLAQSQWLGVYDAWGNWLNDEYTPPEKSALNIGDTYADGRGPMFRRWLLSLPESQGAGPDPANNVDAPKLISSLDDDSQWVTLVGAGSIGDNAPSDHVTRAGLVDADETGRYAWWVGGENQKAKINLAKKDRDIQQAADWELTSGNTAEVGVGSLEGFSPLDDDESVAQKVVNEETLSLVAGIDADEAKQKFFDLTTSTKGVLASVRTGGLKKDLSLLFEKAGSDLPDPYLFETTDLQEPSIRPMSADLMAYNPVIPLRHFQSWTNMRHFYRMYRDTTDASDEVSNSTGGKGSLEWNANEPYTDTSKIRRSDYLSNGDGSNNYWRYPVIAKYTVIFSYYIAPANQFNKHDFRIVYTPVVTLWNPYNVELRVPDNLMGGLFGAPRAWPVSGILYAQNSAGQYVQNYNLGSAYSLGSPTTNNITAWFRSGGGSEIVFEPGQLRVFSMPSIILNDDRFERYDVDFEPGFNVFGIDVGDSMTVWAGSTRALPSGSSWGFSLRFGIGGWVFNMNHGNTPGSLVLVERWGNADAPRKYAIDWFRADKRTLPRIYSESFTPITGNPGSGSVASSAADLEVFTVNATVEPVPFAYTQMVLKGATPFDYDSIQSDWSRADWRCRNWIHAPAFYYGGAMYISEEINTADTQRWDCPYAVNFGPLTDIADAVALADPFGDDSIAILGSGSSPLERVSQVPALELPTAPISSLAGFSGMRINPAWVNPQAVVDASGNPKLKLGTLSGQGSNTFEASSYFAEAKMYAYQSGVTGPGIGNSFLHPIIDRREVYRNYDNSRSQDPPDRDVPENYQENDLKLFRDYWDHTFLLNDALWDDYFLSSLSTHSRTTDPGAPQLTENIARLVAEEPLANNRYEYYETGQPVSEVANLLNGDDGYLRAAAHLVVDGMFNVNSTSVAAWKALFAGIRERKAVYRDANGNLDEIELPDDKRIVITRFNTSIGDEELDDPETGALMPNGQRGWNGVRFLDDDQLQTLAEQCVKQVKLRGPFLNFAEFINRRLSDDSLGVMGALQSAIDYDDENPDPDSINYMFKEIPDYMIDSGDLTGLEIETVEAATGSLFAGVPGYVIQSDLLKPIGNTLAVRDDTFRIRAYGEANGPNNDPRDSVRVWCEAIVQRLPEYVDESNDSYEASRIMNANGEFQDNPAITSINRSFGRKFKVVSFRWLDESEI